MTEPRTQDDAAPTAPPEPSAYSKDYWDIVFEQLAVQRLFKLGLVVLALFYASAIYAPFLANDRPYVLDAIDYRAYSKARKSLYPVTLALRRIVQQTPEAYLAARTEGSTQTYDEALGAERGALVQRLDSMRAHLARAERAPLDAYEQRLDVALEHALAGRVEDAGAVADELKDLAKTIRSDFEAQPPAAEGGDADEAQSTGIALVPERSYPLLEATNAYEVFFMVLWAFVLLWPLWNRLVNGVVLGGDRERIRRARMRKIWGVLALSTVAGVGWKLTIDGAMTFDAATYKSKLSTGELVATRAIFPPIAFGFAETHLAEKFRPPTWTEESAMSEEGYYVVGARVPEHDPVTGFMPNPTPVDMRHAEPDLNLASRHPLGTDSLGRDMLVRMLWGGRVSLAVGIVSTIILMVIGVVIGSVAGYFGGRVDLVISRFIEIVLCFPVFFLILVVVAFVGPSILNIMIVIGLVRWTGAARLTRAEFLKLKEQDFVVAARALGFASRRIVFKHMLPNAMGPLIVAATFSVAAGILVESGLSFLGFGIQLPIPSWGSLLIESRDYEHWWIMVFPGVLIFITVLCYNLVGDGIRDAMDPRLKS